MCWPHKSVGADYKSRCPRAARPGSPVPDIVILYNVTHLVKHLFGSTVRAAAAVFALLAMQLQRRAILCACQLLLSTQTQPPAVSDIHVSM